MSGKGTSSNPILRSLVRRLRKEGKELDAQIWVDLADRLNRSNRSRAELNVSQLNRNTDEGSIVVVPGKVLGSGRLDHPIKVAAFDFSARARRRIESVGGETLSIHELLDENPDGKNVKIME